MKKVLVLLLTVFAVISCSQKVDTEKNDITLRFEDGKFRIAQITDMHWSNGRDTVAIREMLEAVVREDQPQLIVLTGDNVTDADSLEHNKAEWQQVINMLEATGVPYAIVMGNHDAEACDSVDADILESWLTEMPTRCLNYPTTSDCYGHGNKALEILSENSDSVAALVYTIDSNDYPPTAREKLMSFYDWIHVDQIRWYEKTSAKYTAQNGGKPLPALAYFHICVPEFVTVANDVNRFGSFCEPCCPPDLNTGFLASAMYHKDIMGMFVGHDHTNDYCGIHGGIALCYGRQSGVGGNEATPLGSRIVELTEGKREFETWCRTVEGKTTSWYYPHGFNATMFENPLPATELSEVENGVNYTYFEGPEEENCAAILVEKNKKGEGVMEDIDITKAPAEDHFGYIFDTYLLAEETSPFYFCLASDDGALLYIDDKLILDNDGSHSLEVKRTTISLAKGYHHMVVKYFEDYSGQELDITYASKGKEAQKIPANLLFRKK